MFTESGRSALGLVALRAPHFLARGFLTDVARKWKGITASTVNQRRYFPRARLFVSE